MKLSISLVPSFLFILLRRLIMNLLEERKAESKFYEKSKNAWLNDKNKKSMGWMVCRMDRLNIIDRRILIESQIKLSEDVEELVILSENNSPLYDEKITQFYKNHTS